jgi:hypothetical protein
MVRGNCRGQRSLASADGVPVHSHTLIPPRGLRSGRKNHHGVTIAHGKRPGAVRIILEMAPLDVARQIDGRVCLVGPFAPGASARRHAGAHAKGDEHIRVHPPVLRGGHAFVAGRTRVARSQTSSPTRRNTSSAHCQQKVRGFLNFPGGPFDRDCLRSGRRRSVCHDGQR